MTRAPITLRGAVDDQGHLSGRLRTDAARVLSGHAGRDVEIEIRPKRRSLSANAYYHGFVVREVQRALVEAGYTMSADDVHDWLKRRFLPARVVETPTGEVTRYGSTVTDEESFTEYVLAIQSDELLLAMGCYIEEPGVPVRGFRIEEPS